MKRVKSGCICQTLVFSQKPDSGLSKNEMIETNRKEVARYKGSMDLSHTKYVVLGETIQSDGSVLIRIKKQINATIDTTEYFKA